MQFSHITYIATLTALLCWHK